MGSKQAWLRIAAALRAAPKEAIVVCAVAVLWAAAAMLGSYAGHGAGTSLNLAGRGLISVTARMLSSTTALRDLYLDHNKLTSLPAGLLNQTTALQRLGLPRQQQAHIPARGAARQDHGAEGAASQ